MAIALMKLLTPAASAVWINEIHYDNDGADVAEGLEIAGVAGSDLTGWSVLAYNGSNGEVYNTLVLSGVLPDQMSGFGSLAFGMPGLQNGSPDGLALVDSFNAVVQFLSYEGSFAATAGPASGMVSLDIGVSETTSTAVGLSLQLSGAGTSYPDFTWGGPLSASMGFLNFNQSFPELDTEIISEPGPTAGVPEAGASLVLLALAWAGTALLNGARLKEVG